MAKISIQPTPRDKNIPRYGEKIKHRALIEADRSVQSLLSARNLLSVELNHLLYRLLGDSSKIEDGLVTLKNPQYYPAITQETVEDIITSKIKEPAYQEVIKTGDEAAARKLVITLIRKAMDDFRMEARRQLVTEIKEISNGIDRAVDDFEQNSQAYLDILELQRFYLCKQCLLSTSEFRFKKMRCYCGKELNSQDDANEVAISRINNNLADFIKSNMWFEHGVEHLFEDEGYNTQCGYYILGNSGVLHEIDVLAEKPARDKIICECKTTSLNLSDISSFYSKLVDVGAFRGYIFTTALNMSEEVKKFATSKNITIIEAVLETNNQAIKERLRALERL